MTKSNWGHKIFRIVYNYFMFFFLVAFLVSCTTMLFVSTMANSLQLELTDENINVAAKLTFLNVIFLSILFTIIDTIRRKCTTERITKRIAEAAKKVVDGDFNVRIASLNQFGADESLNEIIDCFNTMTEELAGVERIPMCYPRTG